MTKQEFLNRLQKGLSGFSRKDVGERLSFYAEMIADRMEDGVSEEEAVRELGDVDAIIAQLSRELPAAPKKSHNIGTIVLIVLGSPLWLPLLIAAGSVLISLYVVLWALVLSLWAVFVSAAVCAVGALLMGVLFLLRRNALLMLAMAAAMLVLAGISILLFFGCKAVTMALLRGTAKFFKGMFRQFAKKEETYA